jgi:hypothetical protein
VVFDSVGMRPLAGARVQLVALPVAGAPHVTASDSLGGFAFDSLALGRYLLGFSHPRLDSLGLEPALLHVELRTPGTLVAPLSIPSAASLVRATCRADIARDSTGILRGFARAASDGFPVPRARVRVEWPEYELSRGKLREVTRSIDAQANDAGRFLICGIPMGTTVLTRVMAGPDSSGVLELSLPDDGLLRRDLLLGDASHTVDAFERDTSNLRASTPAANASVPRPDSTTSAAAPAVDAPAESGPSPARAEAPRLSGFVRDGEGAPVAGASVTLMGSRASATSRDDGSYLLGDIASGTQMLEVRALGYEPSKVAVDIMSRGAATVDVVLRASTIALAEGTTLLDTMRVRGTDRLAGASLAVRTGFARRAQSGVGYFLSDSVIRAKRAALPSELLRGIPGLTVTNGSGGQGVYMRVSANLNNAKGLCLPTVFIDGSRAPRAVVDQLTNAEDVRAVEIYARGETAPTQFQTNDGCGAIVIWTRSTWETRALRGGRR